MYTLLNWLGFDMAKDWWGYHKRYCDGKQVSAGRSLVWDFSGASNLDELGRRLRESGKFIRRLKREVLTELPEKIRQVIELPTNGAAGLVAKEREDWEKYLELVAALELLVELAKTVDDPAHYETCVMRLRAAAQNAFTEMSSIRRRTAEAKAPIVADHVAAMLEGADDEKIVLFAHHKSVIETFMQRFGEIAVKHTGDCTPKQKQEAVDRFVHDPKVRLFVGNMQSAGVGITLLPQDGNACTKCVFAELDWVPGVLSQAEDRIYRIGQTRGVLVQHLVWDGSIDANIAHAVVAKQRNMDRALDQKFGAVKPITLTEAQRPMLPAPKKGVSTCATADMSFEEVGEAATRITAEEIEAVHVGLRCLSSVCDGAHDEDGVGYNGTDTRIGKALAAEAKLTPRQAALGKRLLRKYANRQLGAMCPEILPVLWPGQESLGTKGAKRPRKKKAA
jgi:hypothetical protein